MDLIESDLQDDIDKAIAAIDIQALIANPEATMLETIKTVEKVLLNRYAPQALKHGIDLSKSIEKKDIIIDPSNDPKENQDVVGNGKEQDKLS